MILKIVILYNDDAEKKYFYKNILLYVYRDLIIWPKRSKERNFASNKTDSWRKTGEGINEDIPEI